MYQKPCALCAGERSCSACVVTASCTDCTASAKCGRCRSVYFHARQASGVVSSLPCPQGKRPCRIECVSTADGERAGTLLDRLALPRDKSGVDAYYTKLASAAVIKSGARWFVDARLWGRNTRWQLRWWCPSQSPADLLRVRRCRACSKWRLLPRHQATEPPAGAFECCELWDERRASCGAGHVVCSWV